MARYQLLTSEPSGDSVANESVALRGRSRAAASTSRQSNGASRPVLTVAVQPDDTLANVALRYAMQVSDLRRLNNFMSEQDLHARATVKVYGSNFASRADDSLISLDDQTVGTSSATGGATAKSGNDSKSDSTSSLDSGVPVATKKFDKIIKGVDKSIADARDAASSSRKAIKNDPLLEELLQAGADGFHHSDSRDAADGRSFVSASRPNANTLLSSYLHRSLLHFVLVLLCVFICIVAPVLVIVFTLEGGSDAHSSPPHHHHT